MKRVFLFVQEAVLGIVGFIGRLLEDEPCQQCIILREWLEQESMERKILLEKLLSGPVEVREDTQHTILEKLPTISRYSSLSHIRKVAEHRYRDKTGEKILDPVAKPTELTEEEILFESELAKVKNG
jgi:hypothetical protein